MSVDTAAKRYSSVNPANPWWGSVFPDGAIGASDRRANLKLYSGLAAGNAYTIEASPGSFVMTGNSAELTPTTNINTAQKRFAAISVGIPWRGLNVLPTGVIGRTPRAVSKNFYIPYQVGATYTITCTSGVFDWVGEPSFSDFEVTANAGSFAMTGNDALLLATRTAILTSGVFTMTGNDANLTHFIERTLVAVSGSFVMTGADAVFDRPRAFEAQTASFGMTGYPAQFTWFNAAGEPYPDPTIRPYVFAGGKKKRNYIIRGRRYYGIDDEELRRLLIQDAEITREEVKVEFKGKKPHRVSKAVFDQIKSQEIDEEEFLLL